MNVSRLLPVLVVAIVTASPLFAQTSAEQEPRCARYSQIVDQEICSALGSGLLPTSHKDARKLGVPEDGPEGLIVIFEERGAMIGAGDVITYIDGRSVRSIEDVRRAIAAAKQNGRDRMSARAVNPKAPYPRFVELRIRN
jgi:S1-C subfamily serine protease